MVIERLYKLKQGIHPRVFYLVCVIFILAASWMAPLGAADVVESNDELMPEIVVKVNGVGIYKRALESEINKIIPAKIVHGSLYEKKKEGIKKQALDNLITEELTHQEAKKMGLSVKRREINKKIKEIKKRLKVPLEEALKRSKYDMEDFRKQIEKELLIRKAIQKVDKDTEAEVKKNITDAYIKEHYDNNKEQYKLPERIRLRAITLKADPGGGPKHWGKIRARSMEILKRIEAGDDFAKLAEANSEDDYAKRGGDMGFIHKGSLVSELGSAVKGLEIGEVAGPVYTMYGFLLLKLEGKMPSIPLEYDEVKEGIKEDLKEREFTRIKKEWIAGLKEKAEIEYLEEESDNKE